MTSQVATLGPPTIGREVKTIDWLVMLDTAQLPVAVRRSLFR